jgi:hypothetical protein
MFVVLSHKHNKRFFAHLYFTSYMFKRWLQCDFFCYDKPGRLSAEADSPRDAHSIFVKIVITFLFFRRPFFTAHLLQRILADDISQARACITLENSSKSLTSK